MPESKNSNDTSAETVDPEERPEESSGEPTADAADGVADEVLERDTDESTEVEADATDTDKADPDGVEVEGELVDLPEELQDIDEDDEADADEAEAAEDTDETGEAAALAAAVAGKGDTAKGDTTKGDTAGTDEKAAAKGSTKVDAKKAGRTVKPPKVKKAEKAKKKSGPAPKKMPKQRRWVAPLMLGCWLLGLAWLVVFYVAGNDIPYMQDLGNWNLLIGMGLIAVGFVVSTQWV